MCNPSNTGHYRYPRFETLSYDEGCHCKEVNNFLKKNDPEKYVLFYTRNISLSGEKQNKITGFFKVGKCVDSPQKGFSSSETILLHKNECIDINYSSRGVPVSWGNSPVKDEVNIILSILRSNNVTNITSQYQVETQKIMQLLKIPQQILDICERCSVKKECYWGKKSKQSKKDKLNKLYGSHKETTCSIGC